MAAAVDNILFTDIAFFNESAFRKLYDMKFSSKMMQHEIVIWKRMQEKRNILSDITF